MDPSGKMHCDTSKNIEKHYPEVDYEMEPEKGDLSPENSKKSDNSPLESSQMSKHQINEVNKKVDLQQFTSSTIFSEIEDTDSVHKVNSVVGAEGVDQGRIEEDLEVRNALAFTIDFGDGRKSVDTQRHEKMLERFQSRHKRGVSLSETGSILPACKMKPPQSVNLPRKSKNNSSDATDIEVRLREKSKTHKDCGNKRHSWSPRSSMTESAARDNVRLNKNNKFIPRSGTLQMAFEQQNATKEVFSSSELNAESLDSSIGLPCIEPPLENFKKDDDESISDAGTYTLDGDNYTEEQKERMNIDRMPSFTPEPAPNTLFIPGSNAGTHAQRPTNFQEELEIIDLDHPCPSTSLAERQKPNILEVSYIHDPSVIQSLKPKQSYLEKLKSRVKNIAHKTKSPEKQPANSPDQGTFTSVTTSGVLSMKPTLEMQSCVHRRNSLTKSHIDSSEYVQGVSKLNINRNDDEMKILNCYTDSEKATKLSCYDSPRHPSNSESSAISSAVSKKDWIQEWAKNAREYSKQPTSSNFSNNSSQMTRSYDFENKNQFGYDFDIDMTKSDYYDAKKYEEFGDNLDRHNLHRKQINRLLNNVSGSDPSILEAQNKEGSNYNEFSRRGSIRQYTSPNATKPPISPSKIPSPIGSTGRTRSVSRNRSLQGSNSDLSTNETEMYLQKTAAAISTLQNLHRRNSLRSSSVHNSSHSSPLSPASCRMSPKISPMNSIQSPMHSHAKVLNIDHTYSPHHQQLRSLKQQQNKQQSSINHKRNLSLDDSESYVHTISSLGYGNQMSNSFNADNMNAILEFKKQHTRHNSFEGMSSLPPKPVKCFQTFEQTTAYQSAKDNNNLHTETSVDDEKEYKDLMLVTRGIKDVCLDKHDVISTKQKTATPTAGKTFKALTGATSRPSSSKVVVNQTQMSPIKRSSSFSVKTMQPTTPTLTPKLGLKSTLGGSKIQKSASSTSFKKMIANPNDEDDDFYINNDDDLDLDPEYSSTSEFSEKDDEAGDVEKEPITNTRYNKTFLMRMEQNKKIAANVKQGVSACPNTPELPRRTLQIRGAIRDRSSMPRDSSLNRMKQEFNVSRKSVSKEFSKESTPTAGGVGSKQKVQPKYMDISKYKAPNAGNFLKKDESKSYLLKNEVKKSPSCASMSMTRSDPNRMSSRSIKSAGPKIQTSAKKDAQKSSKEQELEMWRRRASYDPMKAAMEGKRKQEEARRQAQHQNDRLSKLNESSVLRSQSYHSGVGNSTGRLYHGSISNSSNVNLRGSIDPGDHDSSYSQTTRWTVTSTESSDDYDDEYIN